MKYEKKIKLELDEYFPGDLSNVIITFANCYKCDKIKCICCKICDGDCKCKGRRMEILRGIFLTMYAILCISSVVLFIICMIIFSLTNDPKYVIVSFINLMIFILLGKMADS